MMTLVAGVLSLLATMGGCAVATPESPTSQPPEEPTRVSRVMDGDTFELTTGHKIRVLGINSCESDTPGGVRAKNDARQLLPINGEVTLEWEGNTDKDRYGRHLRYVLLPDGRDFAQVMVVKNHTEAYKGGDASKDYQDKMLVLDTPPRVCEE